MGPRVLCVDDDYHVRDAVATLLELMGIEVRCVENGSRCVEEFEAGRDRYDLVMVNYDMPGMGGPEVVRRLRRIDERKKIALTSAFPSEEVFQTISPAEVAAFLPKPYSLPKLRRFLQILFSSVRPEVLAILDAGVGPRKWLEALGAGGEGEAAHPFKVSCHLDPDEALRAASGGRFSMVILWEAGPRGIPFMTLERFRVEQIPMIFLTSGPTTQHLERWGLVLPAEASSQALESAIRRATGGVIWPSREVDLQN